MVSFCTGHHVWGQAHNGGSTWVGQIPHRGARLRQTLGPDKHVALKGHTLAPHRL
jgi:hypothetical protein